MLDTEKPFHCATRWEGFFLIPRQRHTTSQMRVRRSHQERKTRRRGNAFRNKEALLAHMALGGLFFEYLLMLSNPETQSYAPA